MPVILGCQFTGDVAMPVNRLWYPWLRINRLIRVMRDVSNIGDVDLEITAEELLGEVMLAPARDRRYCPRGYRHFKEGA